MTVMRTNIRVWEALAGRAPGRPLGPADAGLWTAVVERINPARATPALRSGIERVELISVRGVPYVMLRSPDDRGRACYLRLSLEEARLAELMDGTLTVARLVAEFARIAGRLAPDQVRRVVADLAANRMLAELPVDAFRPLREVRRRPWPVRLGQGMLAVARGRRTVVANIDPLVTLLYQAGGRLLFTRPAAVLFALVAVAGMGLFTWSWATGARSLFRAGGSYAIGAAILLGLNVLALACHELGHALAVKHAGRRVPAAGVLVYFGIPSVFVDTTDVWLAGRRARLLATAAGPTAGLVLAGVAQLVGVLAPALAPTAFVLSFAWYLNALFNLNPMLALDGYYLLMDWLEVPNLRARGLAWVLGRLRGYLPAGRAAAGRAAAGRAAGRRGTVSAPAWRELDQEGRIVALYGMIAVAWMIIAVNLGWRIWTDRIAGLTLGLWRHGWAARLLLIAVVVGLASPIGYAMGAWLARRARLLRQRVRDSRRAVDLPRRLAVLRTSALAGLPAGELTRLAELATWRYPKIGEPVVCAGTAQRDVLVVAEGRLEARRPGDPAGTVRQRVGVGGVVGLANALAGTPAALTWHTAGTRLLAVPASAVAVAVGSVPGPPPVDRVEAEDLFAGTPALEDLPDEDRMGLAAGARPELLAPGAAVELVGDSDAVVVAAGEVTLPDGSGLRRGTMIGPMGEQPDGPVATARTAVRLWRVPAVSGLPLLCVPGPRPGVGHAGVGHAGAGRYPGSGYSGTGWLGVAARGTAPVVGVHPVIGYPPLAVPPGPPPEDIDEDVDRRFERRLWWLLLLLLLLGLLLTGTNLLPGPAWAEMPADRALLAAERGRVTVTVGRETIVLRPGDRVYMGAGDRVAVGNHATGRLTYRGGATTTICAGGLARVGSLWTDRSVAPYARLELLRGRLLADTASPSPAFADLGLAVGSRGHSLINTGAARHLVVDGRATVAAGRVARDGVPLPVTGGEVSCGGRSASSTPQGPGGAVRPSTRPTGGVSPSPTPRPSAPSPVSPTTGTSPSPSPRIPTGTPSRPGGPTGRPSATGPTRPSVPGRPTTRPPIIEPTRITPSGDQTVPDIGRVSAAPSLLAQQPPPGTACSDAESRTTRATVTAVVTDQSDDAEALSVQFTWILSTGQSGGGTMDHTGGGTFIGGFSIDYLAGQESGGTVTIRVTVRDPAGNGDTETTTIQLDRCTLRPIIR